MTALRQNLFALAAIISASCSHSEGFDSESSSPSTASGVAGVATGIVVVANPLNCGLTGADLNRLNGLYDDDEIEVVMAFVASPHDSVAVTATVESMGLTMPHIVMSVQEYTELFGPLRPRLPAFIVVKQGNPLMTMGSMDPWLALDLVEALRGS